MRESEGDAHTVTERQRESQRVKEKDRRSFSYVTDRLSLLAILRVHVPRSKVKPAKYIVILMLMHLIIITQPLSTDYGIISTLFYCSANFVSIAIVEARHIQT